MNETGFDSGLSAVSELGDLPVLQDTPADAVWTLWDVTYRDVYILNADGELVDVYNLTVYDLGDDANFEELKSKFAAASDSGGD